jgi:hypothetical protein
MKWLDDRSVRSPTVSRQLVVTTMPTSQATMPIL